MDRQSKPRVLGALITLIVTLLAWRSIPAQSQAPSTLKIESDDTQVLREGQWISQPTSTASGGGYLYNTPANAGSAQEAVLQLTFVGPTLEVIYVSGPTLGTLALEVDGTVLRTVITTADQTSYSQSSKIDYLTDESHILRVYAQEGDVVGVDAFIISSGEGANGTMRSATPRDALGSGGWMATYFRRFPTSTSCTIPALTDSPPPSGATMYSPYPVAEISFDWGSTGGPSYVAPTTDTFGIIFRRTVTFAEDTTLTINYWADDGIRMLDNGTRFVNSWGCNAGAPASIIRTFAAGVHNLEIQYVEITGQAHIVVTFSTPLLTATPIATTQVHLAWNDSFPDETDYRVERSPISTPNWAEIATLPADSASYDDTGLVCGTYTYRVRAYYGNTATYSIYSNVATVDTGPCMNNPPTGLTATAVDFGQIQLDWTDNASDETEYRLERSWDGVNYWLALGTVPADTTTYTITGRFCNTTEYYRIRGYRASDTAFSAYSAVANGVTLPCLTAAPTNLTATVLAGGQIQLIWTDNSTSESEFRIRRSPSGLSNWTTIYTAPADNTTYIDTGLACGTPYDYLIYAYRTADSSSTGFSNLATATAPCLPLTPTNLTATPFTDSQIQLTWVDNASDETDYRLERSPDGINNWVEIGTAPTNTTTYTNVSLICSTAYSYRVRAYRASDMTYSAYSNVANATTAACPTNCLQSTAQVQRVSESSSGVPAADGFTGPHSVSDDGHYVVFTSSSSNLVPNDTFPRLDIFVRDTVTCQTTLVSVASNGTQSNDLSWYASISGDGRYVVFESGATTLDSADTSNDVDAFVHDRQTGTTRIVSHSLQNPTVGSGFWSMISGNGHYAVFTSEAALISSDTNGVVDVYLRDLQTNTLELISLTSTGGLAQSASAYPYISYDGRYVTFLSYASLVPDVTSGFDVYWLDRMTGELQLASYSDDESLHGTDHRYLNQSAFLWPIYAPVTDDGRYVAFATVGPMTPDDVDEDFDAYGTDVFVRDMIAGTTTLISVDPLGDHFIPSMSSDGRYLTFASTANRSNMGYAETDVFLVDMVTGTTRLISRAYDGRTGNYGSAAPTISRDGRYIAFYSNATNLIQNGTAGVYLADTTQLTFTLLGAPNQARVHITWNNEINLRWDDPNPNETSYLVERSLNSSTEWTQIADLPADTKSLTDPSLVACTTYYYRVRAYRASDAVYSPYSNVVSIVAANCPPTTPTNLSASSLDASQIRLTWADNAPNETAYRVERSENGTDGWIQIADLPANTMTYTDSGLTCGTGYYYRVRAYRNGDNRYSAYSNVANATTSACPLIAPTNLTWTALSTSQIRLTWTDTNTSETNYRVERSPDGVTNWVEIGTVAANGTTYTNTGLTCNTPYQYRVRAHRASDTSYSTYSNVVNATTVACPPDALAIFNPTTHTAHLIKTLTNPPATSDYVYYTTGFPYGAGGQYVMGDWNGDGLDTMGVYRNGAFWYTNDYGQTGNWTGIWFGLGGQAIAGHFNGTVGHDCIGVTDSGTWTTGDTFFALYFTCNLTSGPTPTLTYQWLSIVLPTSGGHSGTFQFGAGDFDGDGVDSIAIRRGNYVAWTNIAPTTLLSEFNLAQYFGAPGMGDEGKFVVGDWDLNNVDSFGLVYQNGRFYRRDDLQWNSGAYTLQQFTPLVGTPFGVTTWRPS